MQDSFIVLITAPILITWTDCNLPKMKSEGHHSTKYFPGITTRKPQLRSNSWAKLLSQNKSRKSGELDTEVSGLDVSCTSVLFSTKVTRRTCQNLFENLTKSIINERDKKGNANTVDEMQQIEENEISEVSIDQDEDSEESRDTSSRSFEDVTKVSRANSDNERIKRDQLPPLAHTATAKPEKIPKERLYTRSRDSKGHNDSLPSNVAIDWQSIFVNGGFRPHESRDLPTRGELKLLKYKTWDPDDPVYCVGKCAKYFGLDSAEIEKGHLTPTEKELRKHYNSPPSPNFKFYRIQVPKRHKAFAPLGSSSESLTYFESPAKQLNLCNSYFVPPATPASSMVRSSPFGLSPLPYKDRGKNTLAELTETPLDGQNTYEGIVSPTESELEL